MFYSGAAGPVAGGGVGRGPLSASDALPRPRCSKASAASPAEPEPRSSQRPSCLWACSVTSQSWCGAKPVLGRRPSRTLPCPFAVPSSSGSRRSGSFSRFSGNFGSLRVVWPVACRRRTLAPPGLRSPSHGGRPWPRRIVKTWIWHHIYPSFSPPPSGPVEGPAADARRNAFLRVSEGGGVTGYSPPCRARWSLAFSALPSINKRLRSSSSNAQSRRLLGVPRWPIDSCRRLSLPPPLSPHRLASWPRAPLGSARPIQSQG